MWLNNREIDLATVEIGGVDTSDYPDFCDTHFIYAEYLDSGEELTDYELECLGDEYPDVLNEMAFQSLV